MDLVQTSIYPLLILCSEELDSYLYQTVGQDAIELVANSLEVPLYRRAIIGNALAQDAEYGTRASQDGVAGDGE